MSYEIMQELKMRNIQITMEHFVFQHGEMR